jgi:predicted TIM-barrel fold metal-dependent hydrolase
VTSDRLPLIGTEEAFACEEWAEAIRRLESSGSKDPDLRSALMLCGGGPPVPERARAWFDGIRRDLFADDASRIAVMDDAGVDVFVLSLVSPGLQLFDADTGAALATLTNDILAEKVRRHPDRFGGLASFAPQDPARAALEIERAITKLGLNGLIVNSHTNGEYLDDPKYWPILEAACAVDAPIYIHPRDPPVETERILTLHDGRSIQQGVWGFHMETSLHAVRLLMSGVLDRFPKLKIVLGHMGEGVPYWLARLNWVAQRRAVRLPSDAFKDHFTITTSGAWSDPHCHPMLAYCHAVLGAERIMFAVDHPFADARMAAEFMRSAPFDAEDRAQMAWRNAARVFRLPSRGAR